MAITVGALAVVLAALPRLRDQGPEEHLLDVAKTQGQPTSAGQQFTCG
jgi:hypothetical protein